MFRSWSCPGGPGGTRWLSPRVPPFDCFPRRGPCCPPAGVTIAQLGIEHLSLFGSTARGGAREESDIDLFFDYERQKGKVGLFDLVDVKEPSRSSSTMTRAFCQLSAAARLACSAVCAIPR